MLFMDIVMRLKEPQLSEMLSHIPLGESVNNWLILSAVSICVSVLVRVSE